MREQTMYPLQLHERWEEEYRALQTTEDKAYWVAQKVEERKVINAVWDMERFANSANSYLAAACQTLRKMGRVSETGSRDGEDSDDRPTQSYVCRSTFPSFVALNPCIASRSERRLWDGPMSYLK